MLTLLAALAAMQAAVAPAPAATAQMIESIEGAKIHRYSVSGANGKALQKSLNAAMKAQPQTVGQLFTWTAKIGVTKETIGDVCTIKAADAKLDANVYLPQLTEEAKVPAGDLKQWKTYEAGLEKSAADNLRFVADRLPAVEQSLVGKPCDQAATIWTDGMNNLIKQQQAFDAQLGKKK